MNAQEIYETYVEPLSPDEQERLRDLLGPKAAPLAKSGRATRWTDLGKRASWKSATDAQTRISQSRRESDAGRSF